MSVGRPERSAHPPEYASGRGFGRIARAAALLTPVVGIALAVWSPVFPSPSTAASAQPSSYPATPFNDPQEGEVPFRGQVVRTAPNCGLTEIRGRVLDQQRQPLAGYRGWVSGQLSPATGAEGEWQLFLSMEEALEGLWEVWLVDAQGEAVSDTLVLRTQRQPCSPGSSGVQSIFLEFKPAPPPGAPAPVPPPFPFKGLVAGTDLNCNKTELRGKVLDADGNPMNGWRVRVTWPSSSVIGPASGSEGRKEGHWDVFLDGEAKDGLWEVWLVDQEGQQTSDRLEVRTTKTCHQTPDTNIIFIDFHHTP